MSAGVTFRALRTSVGPAAGLSVAMGIGRFVYTPILPRMAAALDMPSSHGSWIAAANYLGYLLGAWALTQRPDWTSTTALRTGLLATVVLLAVMPVTGALPWFLLVRLVAGVAAAVVFVCVAQVVPTVELAGGATGLVYAGVGAGITLSGVTVALADSAPWSALWLLSAVGAGVLALVAWPVQVPSVGHEPRPVGGGASRVPVRLTVAYLLEGVGYIIIGTYLVTLVAVSTGARTATWVWVVAGLSAVASPVLWKVVASRTGARKALVLAYVLQLLAALVPVVSADVAGGFAGAALFGATFMGITQMTMAEAHRSGVIAAAAGLTLVYALGQLLGPVIVAVLPADRYGPAFLVAVVLLGIAGAVVRGDQDAVASRWESGS